MLKSYKKERNSIVQLPQLSDEELGNMEVLQRVGTSHNCFRFATYLKAGSKLFYGGQLIEGIDMTNLSLKDWKAQNYPPEDENDEYPLHFFDETSEYFVIGDKVLFQNKIVPNVSANEFYKATGYTYNRDLYAKVGEIVIKDGEIVKDLKANEIEDLYKKRSKKR